jgi:glucose-6-phosphate isomerase
MQNKEHKITKEEYLSAINTVNAYNTQVTEEFKEMKKNLTEKAFSAPVPITKDTIFIDLKTNGYQSKIICKIISEWSYFKRWRDVITVESSYDVTLEHISHIKKIDILALRNVGDKSVEWLERTLFEAGLSLQD